MPSALGQLEEARTWWLQHRDKAPFAFDEEVGALFDLLEDRPGLVGRPVIEPPGTRRVYLARIRYYVYFQVSSDEELVEILALWHASRGSGPQL
jgi:plasmid stabilization system protein ParE